ncbi:MAG: acetyl-CoA carboxylase biotin carboxyl carrier protein [Candidatus Marinimicrobia bacterium]|nr:acetyl-CoA carboxylase biotin carboxyl carrier protein [Candidatus Neomarinimicrobiota bacterium]MCF7840423.1 acetyl-CoA carboxylase biotin carboxyl carrier protein [Candidatus Neomarinimicrobiota bacterium]MCF7903368.1 acetyl-CoA carboxylase biotin carboxyl carrier protein [Candidatus Neomarinimicrobiota bacterium]
MNIKQIQKLIDLLDQSNGISEIEYSRWGQKIRVSKAGNGLVKAIQPQEPASAVPVTPPAQKAEAAEKPATAGNGSGVEFKSPMVGTFYRASAPDADPFVKVGDHVTVGQTLCIIEAMKIMNEIEAEVSGVVSDILVENAQPVEYNQPLFIIES